MGKVKETEDQVADQLAIPGPSSLILRRSEVTRSCDLGPFENQAKDRADWRRYVDALGPHLDRPDNVILICGYTYEFKLSSPRLFHYQKYC